jgi:predicted enzyme involved in methoxymalonyl-ACP biosynthesis
VSDKFGDSGVTGLIIISDNPKIPNECEIDSFLMSCRVLGRNIELKFFDEVIKKLKAESYKSIKAKFIPTSKNAQVANFYEKVGFIRIYESGEATEYILNTEYYSGRDLPYIEAEEKNE